MIFFFILIPVPVPFPQQPPAAIAPHYPVLTVVDAETGKPVEGARVYDREGGGISGGFGRDLGCTGPNGQLPLPPNGTGSLVILKRGYGSGHASGGVADRTVRLGEGDIN